MTFKHVELEQLLRKDEAHWVSAQDKARKAASQVSEKIAAMIEAQKAQMMALLGGTFVETCTFKRLPMWGEEAYAGAVNFSWPT